jgi:arylsulfatase A-like enzyme
MKNHFSNSILQNIYKPLTFAGLLCLNDSCGPGPEKQPEKPNVLFIICDDLNDFIGQMGGHPQAKTPNIDRLMQQGIKFTNAHSNDPVSAPSRASMLTGLYPHTSGLYSFEKWYKNPTLKNCNTIMEVFSENDYQVMGTGKILHHNDTSLWDEFGNETDYGPYAFNGTEERKSPPWDGLVAHSSVLLPFGNNPFSSFAPLSEIPNIPRGENFPGFEGWWDGYGRFNYIDENNRDLMPDEKNALWIENKIRELEQSGSEQPFFLAVGFIRPHTPLHAPKKYFDMFPPEKIILPPYLENDLEDCADGLVNHNGYPKGNYKRLIQAYKTRENGLKEYVRAYLACVAFVDEQVGRVLEALEKSRFKENTIVIFTSDHGYHLGEKDVLFKHTLWDESTRIPLAIKASGITKPGTSCDHPVSLIDLYPTMVDLCDLESNNMKNREGAPTDGFSLKPFLVKPGRKNWPGPEVALSAIISDKVKEGRNIPMKAEDQHFSVRSLNWRYSLTYNNEEELYDHRNDSNEWYNLAQDPEYEKIKKDLRETLENMTGR